MDAVESLVIILPLPSGLLSPNHTIGSIGGRFAKAAAIKKYRRLAKEAVENEQIETAPWREVTVEAAFYFDRRGRRDPDNATGSLKAAYDGTVDAGLIVDDDWEHMTRLPPFFFLDRKNPRVELLIVRVK